MRKTAASIGLVAILLASACDGAAQRGATDAIEEATVPATVPEGSDGPGTDQLPSEQAEAGGQPQVATRVSSFGPDERGNGWDVEYPFVRGIDPAIATIVNDTIFSELHIAELAIPEDAAEYDGVSWDESGTFIVGMATPQLLSVQIDQYLFTGGAHGMPGTWFLTFDLTTGALIEATDLLSDGALAVLAPEVKADLDRQLPGEHDASDATLLDDPPVWAAGLDAHGNLSFVFQAYGIGPYSMGMPRVDIGPERLAELGLVPEASLLSEALAITADQEAERVAVLAQTVAEYRIRPDVCGGYVDESLGPDGDHLEITIRDQTIVFVRCSSAAYQAVWEARSWDGAVLGRVEMEQWIDGEIVSSPVVVGFPDAGNGVIVNLSKARGPGDCGTLQEWWLDGDRLVLSQVRDKACDDSGEYVPPDQWPMVHP